MATSKNLRAVLEYLGEPYTVKVIDLEDCAYRRLNDKYDIEISGCNRKTKPFHVYVWNIQNGDGIGAQIIERSGAIKGLPALKTVLDEYVQKYSG
ncbi:hypothetical protein [Paenibacillus senegalimassiliensis]|uniref:hypothetical protein n=1 Tax=Paenibacillus senegalimassiliensis TaxID=1737426 RepID=UPI001651F09F|nr:hypothetical protein [Paenibacillus senegalimassiliensis]